MATTEKTLSVFKSYARNGFRIRLHLEDTEKSKTLWAGLGNRSGLHSFADTLLREKWDKSGDRFTKKLEKVFSGLEGGMIEVQDFRNISRDRGRWVTVLRYTV